jgi:hypothetical protein
MDYRGTSGEEITEKSWVMRHLWNAKKGRKFGLVTAPKKLKSSGVKRLVEDALIQNSKISLKSGFSLSTIQRKRTFY